MPLLFPLAAVLLGTALLLLRGSLSEELLLLVASTIFFGTVFVRLRPLVASWVGAQADELYGSLATLLELRLLRLAGLVGLGRRLVALVRSLDRLLVALAPLFLRGLPPSPLPLVGLPGRQLATVPGALDRLARQRRLRLLSVALVGFGSLLGDRLTLTPP